MAVGDLYRATYHYNVARQPVMITLGYESTSFTGDGEKEGCALISLQVGGQFALYANIFGNDVSLEGCQTYKITGDPQAPGEAWANGVVGLYPSQSIPATKSLMVNHKQQSADVRRNGKSYVAGIPESITEGNSVVNATVPDSLVALFQSITTIDQAIGGGTFTAKMVVLSHPENQPTVWQGLEVTSHNCRMLLYNSKRRNTREVGFSRDVVLP